MLGLVVVLLLVGVLAYLVLPTLIESRIAANLKERYGLAEGPVVKVYSEFPPELLLGRADQVEVWIGSFTKEGIPLRNLHVDMEYVDVSVPGLLQGGLEREIRSGALTAEVPEESINQYLQENELDLEGKPLGGSHEYGVNRLRRRGAGRGGGSVGERDRGSGRRALAGTGVGGGRGGTHRLARRRAAAGAARHGPEFRWDAELSRDHLAGAR